VRGAASDAAGLAPDGDADSLVNATAHGVRLAAEEIGGQMPRIEPIPMHELPAASRRIIEEGVADGLYATPVPLQLFAYRTAQLADVHRQRTERGVETLLGGRILELIRIRSAQLGECQPCMQSRKHDSITDADVACLLLPGHSDLSSQERLAVEFIDLLSADHHAMDDAFYRRLAEVFSTAQIIELGCTAAAAMGMHRFLHTLDVFGTSPPAIAYDARQVDTAKADAPDGRAPA
jgi:alkylhydroperoxidase family enzyme